MFNYSITSKSELQLACELIRLLDGISIEQARNALMRACDLLSTTQMVHADSPLLCVVDETDAALIR